MRTLWTIVAIVVVAVAIIVWLLCRPTAEPPTPQEPAPMDEPAGRVSEAPAEPHPATVHSSVATRPAATPAAHPAADEARWAEAKTAMGTIATAIRAYFVEVGPQGRPPASIEAVGLTPMDLEGVYFGPADYSLSVTSMDPLTFTVTCTPGSKPDAPTYPASLTVDAAGNCTWE